MEDMKQIKNGYTRRIKRNKLGAFELAMLIVIVAGFIMMIGNALTGYKGF